MDTIRKTGQVFLEASKTFSRAGFGPSLGLDDEDHFETTSAKNVSIEEPLFKGEFPNYFHTNDPVQAARIKAKVNLAMASVLKRLDLPHIDPETGKIKRDGFFEALENHVQAQDPGAKVYISGGVVRSILGYIYKKLYNEHQRGSTPKTTEQVLDRIIAGESRKPLQGPLDEQSRMAEGRESDDRRLIDKELEKLRALGIGSDLDISIEFSKNFSERERVKNSVAQFIDSAIDQLMPGSDKRSTVNHSILPVGDAVDRETQLKRSMAQGGSPLDWLAFPVTSRSGEQIQEGVPGTMQRYLQQKRPQ